MTQRLEGKRAVVIGAGSVGEGIGNGRASAMLFARHGAQVLCVDRDLQAAARTAELIAEEGHRAEILQLDITADAEVEARLSDAVDALWSGIDILYYGVGISKPGGVVETDPRDWDTVFSVNLRGAYLTARCLVPKMVARRSGSVILVSSLAGVWSGPYSYAAYEASKAGLNRMGRSLARAHAADGVRCNVIAPGVIDTPHVRAFISGQQPDGDRAAMVPMKRQGSPWDVAEAALFFASDASSYVTGTVLAVDGGLSA